MDDSHAIDTTMTNNAPKGNAVMAIDNNVQDDWQKIKQ